MDELIKEFALEREVTNSEGNIYIGSIRDKKAILIFPNQSISKDTLLEVLPLPKEVTQANDIYRSYRVFSSMNIHFRSIYPATDSHIKKYCSKNVYIRETYEDYLKFLEQDLHIGSNWMENLAGSTGETVTECILYSDEEMVIIPDYKWDRQSNDRIHLLTIFKDPKLRTVRDIDDRNVLVKAYRNIENVLLTLGLGIGDVFMFFHYRPSYYRLHLHILNIKISFEGIASAIRAIPLHDVMYNLQLDPNYYRRDMFVLSKEADKDEGNTKP